MEDEIVGTAEEMYVTIKNEIHQVALEYIGTKEKSKYNNSWCTDDLKASVEENKRLYLKWLDTKDEEDRKIFKRYNYLVKKEIKRIKNKSWENKCAEINSMVGGSRSREAWKTINSLRENTNKKRKINPMKIK